MYNITTSVTTLSSHINSDHIDEQLEAKPLTTTKLIQVFIHNQKC